MYWNNEKRTREIKIIVPIKRFEKLPDVIDYSHLRFGKMEKAQRLLMRSMHSALDNGDNYKLYRKLTEEYRFKRNIQYGLKNKISVLEGSLSKLREASKQYGLKIEGCSSMVNDKKELKAELKVVEAEMKKIKEELPFSVKTYYWW